MIISDFSVVPSHVVPGESFHCEFTVKVESGDECNGLQVYAGNSSNYMAFTDAEWRLAAGKSARVSFDRVVPTHLELINSNLETNRTYTDPRWTIQLGAFGTSVFVYEPVTYLNMRYLPTIAEFALERADSGIANDEGENVLTSLRVSVSEGADVSDMSLKLYYAENAAATLDSAYIDFTGEISGLLTGVFESTSLIADTFSNGSNWNFMLVFGDAYETSVARLSLTRSFANVHMSGCRTGGVCFGGFSTATEGNPKFETYYPIFAYGGIEPIETVYPAVSSGISTPGDYGGTLVFRRVGRLVIISGSIKLTEAASSKVICSLPENCIPVSSHYYIGAMTGSQIARLAVYGSNDGAESPGTLMLEWVKRINSTSNVSSTQSWIECSTFYWVN